MSDITLASKEYVTGETEERLTLASKEYVDSKITEYPENSFVFFYKDNDANIKRFDATNSTNGTELFKDNANIAVDWKVDMPNLEGATEMFANSRLKSFDATMAKVENIQSCFQGCTNLSEADVTIKGTTSTSASAANNVNNTFAGCTNLTDVKLVIKYSAPIVNATFDNVFDGCSKLADADIFFDLPGFRGGAYLQLTDAFKGCTSLKNINIHSNKFSGQLSSTSTIVAAGMFDGCLLGPDQLQQIVDWNWWPRNTTAITIGIDSTKVTQTDIDTNWHGKFVAKNWNVTWQLNPAGTLYVSQGITELPPSRG